MEVRGTKLETYMDQDINNNPVNTNEKRKAARHFILEFFIVLFANLTNFLRKKDKEIETRDNINDSVIKHD